MHCLCKTKLLYLVFNTFWLLLSAQQNATNQQPEIISSSQNITLAQNDSVPPNVSQKYDNSTSETDSVLRQRMVTYCTTPNDDQGFCMPIRNCTKLLNQQENKSAKKFIQKSKCGPKNEKGDNPSVCCGKYSNFKHLEPNPFPKSCGRQNVTIKGRILGGVQAELGEFPWLARLFHRDGGRRMFGCSGFLIASKFVLTAAHCLMSDNVQALGPIFEVHLGEHNTDTEIDCNNKNTTCADRLQKIRVKSTIVHPSYNMSSRHHHHDIGLIHLKKGAQLTSYVYPICLLDKMNFEPFEYWLSGWGATETGGLSHLKLKVSVPPYPHSNCTNKYKPARVKIIDKQLCVGGKKNKDSCTGDSGGPLMLVVDGNHWFAAGVVSYGLGCGREGWPAIYTNVTSYHDWIKKTMLKSIKTDEIKTRRVKN